MALKRLKTRLINDEDFETAVAKILSKEKVWCNALRLLMTPYYLACQYSKPDNRSIVVEDDERIVLVLPMVLINNRLSYYGMAIKPVFSPLLPREEYELAMHAAYNLATNVAIQEGYGIIIERPPISKLNDALAPWELDLLKGGAVQHTSYRAIVPLSGGETAIFQQMRRSYRSLVNWGRREITTVLIEEDNIDKNLFGTFREFHLRVAGKVTRPERSWEEMYNLLVQGRALLCLGYIGESLVAATYMFFDGKTALYGTGVYDRNYFQKPIAHWPLLKTILRAYERGAIYCDLGEVFLTHGSTTKEKNIAFFKKGFTDNISSAQIWVID